MRKLGIIIAIAAVATLGFAGRASAQLEPLCGGAQMIADGAAENDPTPNPGGPGTPVKQIAQGGADACNGQDPLPLLCGVADGVEAITGANPLTDGIQGETCATSTSPDPDPAPTGDDDDDDDDDSKPAVEDDVVENNASAGGTLPRTGGELELLGGLSMGLTGLGVFARRFLR